MNIERAPLYDKLAETARRQFARLHVPGHKSGKALTSYSNKHFQSIMDIDMTEISGLDDLHHPAGVIMEAQILAALCFGAEETFFLVGGSTVGNMAMILATCDRGDLILMQRNVHKSAIHACMLAGCRIAFVNPRWYAHSQLATGVSVASVREALKQYPEAKALFLTNPNYYGMGSDLSSIADEVHARGIPLLVDEAHGAHYGFHPGVPASAMSCGADASVQSTHKMLTSLTMGAMLHIQGSRINRDIVRQRLAMLQSSSPSYPIMASLDLSRQLIHTQGHDLIDRALIRISSFREKLMSSSPDYELLHDAPTSAYETLDPFKIAIRSSSRALSGFQLQEQLELNGCVAEMADPLYVLLALSSLTSDDELDRLFEALQAISMTSSLRAGEDGAAHAQHINEDEVNSVSVGRGWNLADMAMAVSTPVTIELPAAIRVGRDAVAVRLAESIGRTAAEMIIPYPPGIPLLYPGEPITEQTVAYLTQLVRLGARFQGAHDSKLETVLVR